MPISIFVNIANIWSCSGVPCCPVADSNYSKTITTVFFYLEGGSRFLLTYSMVQSSSWETNWFAASQEIPRISRNPKVHYCTHKRPPPGSILGQPNPVHIHTSHLLEIHPNIIHPSKPMSPQWSPSLRFPNQDPRLLFYFYSVRQHVVERHAALWHAATSPNLYSDVILASVLT